MALFMNYCPLLRIIGGTNVAHLVLDVDVEVALHGPHVLVAVAGGRQDLEADVPQRVQDHHGAEGTCHNQDLSS